jgi:hypothetical protein
MTTAALVAVGITEVTVALAAEATTEAAAVTAVAEAVTPVAVAVTGIGVERRMPTWSLKIHAAFSHPNN